LGRARTCVIVAFAAAAVAMPAEAKLTAVPSVQAVVTVEPNGVLDLLERVNVRADQPTAATWQVAMLRGELFAQPSVYVGASRYRAGDGKHAGTFLISRGRSGIRFDWLQPEGAHSVRIAYRLALVGTAYADVVDLRMPVWERDWPAPVRELTAAVTLPKAPHGRVIVWVEPKSLEATVRRVGKRIRMRTHDVRAGDRVTLHTVLPRTVLSSFEGVTVETKPGLDAILAARRGNGQRWWPWAAAAGVALGVSAFALRTARSRRPQRR
jgi:hypothetical protein